jgi:hypothetical protein
VGFFSRKIPRRQKGYGLSASADFGSYNNDMLLSIGWIVLLCEFIVSLVFGFVFRRFWSQATIARRVRIGALIVYSIGCLLILTLAMSLPL